MTRMLQKLTLAGSFAVLACAYAIAYQWHPTYRITASAEDMCPYFYGAYALDNVEPAGTALVVCTYE
jgi:hypothetical protein